MSKKGEKRRSDTSQTQTPKRVKALTANQQKYLAAVEQSVVTICTGPAGTGKTFVACGLAARQLTDGKVERIVIARPLVLCGTHDLGAFPGDVTEKVSPYMRPLLDAFEDFFSPYELEKLIAHRTIELMPLELMRGSSLKNAFIICDEAQNCTFAQLKMFLTRFGQESTVVITGDPQQSDLPYDGRNSLVGVIDRFKPSLHPSISIVRLGREDIVRHPLISWIDERLTGSGVVGEQEGEATEDKKSEFIVCPQCDQSLYYDDNGPHDVEQVQCWNCGVVLEVPEFEDEWPVVATVKLSICVPTRAETASPA